MKSKAPRLDCEPSDLATALATMSGKWKLRIICLLFDGTKPFSALRRMLPGIHRGTLTYEISRSASRRRCSSSALNIPPFREFIGLSENVYRCPVQLARLAPDMSDDAETRKPRCEEA